MSRGTPCPLNVRNSDLDVDGVVYFIIPPSAHNGVMNVYTQNSLNIYPTAVTRPVSIYIKVENEL